MIFSRWSDCRNRLLKAWKKVGVHQTLGGTRHTVYFCEISWEQFQCVLGIYNVLGWPGKSLSYPSKARMVLIHRRRKDGKLVWAGPQSWTSTRGTRNSWRLLLQRHHVAYSSSLFKKKPTYYFLISSWIKAVIYGLMAFLQQSYFSKLVPNSQYYISFKIHGWFTELHSVCSIGTVVRSLRSMFIGDTVLHHKR